jgi:ATP-dependent Clp protease ATP-binding subunit ClpA
LTKNLIRGIVQLQIKLLEKLLMQKDLKLEISSDALDELAKEGYDPAYGARPLKRLIQKKIQDRLALMLLNGKISPGNTIHLGTDKSGNLVFK